MKKFALIAFIASLTAFASADMSKGMSYHRFGAIESKRETKSFATPLQLPPPSTTWNVEAVWDQENKSAIVGASVYWKTFTGVGPSKKSIDLYWFGGVDKHGVPCGALTGKIGMKLADQLTLFASPGVLVKQNGRATGTLFVGVSLR